MSFRGLAVLALLALVAPPAEGARFSLATIPVGEGAGRTLAAPGLGYVFVAVANENKVVAIRVADDTVTSTFSTGTRPNSLAFDPLRQRLVVAGPGRVEAYSLDTIGMASQFNLTSFVDVPGLIWPLAAEWDVEHDRLLLTDLVLAHVASVDGGSFTFLEGTAAAEVALQILIGPRLVLPSGATASVTELNAHDLSAERVMRGIGWSISAAYSARRDRVYSVDKFQSWLAVCDFGNNSETYVPIGSSPWSIAPDEANDRIFIGYWRDNFVTKVDGATLATSNIPLPGPGRTVVHDGARSLLYAADLTHSRVSVIDTGDDRVLGTFPTGQTPGSAALDAASHKLYISNYDAGTVTRICPGVSPGGGQSDVSVDPEVIPADAASRSLVTVLPRDEDGDPLGPGHQVVIQTTAGTLVPPVHDEGDGRYTQELVSTVLAETAIVSAVVDGQALVTRPRVSFHRDGWADIRDTQPEWGFTSGGTTVTLSGSGFFDGIDAGASVDPDSYFRVSFDGVPAAALLSVTDGAIVCLTPAHAAGVVDVAVAKRVDDEWRESFLRQGFTYAEDEDLSLSLVKGGTLGEVRLAWSSGPSGPVRLLQSPDPSFAATVSETTELSGPSATDFPPYSPTFYRIER